MTQKTESCGL